MAFYGKSPSLLFLLVLLFSIYQIQARESKFFSKVTHYSNNKDLRVPFLEVPSTSPTLAPAPASEQTIAQNGYGLYGPGSTTKTTPTSSTTASANDENEIIPEELANESYKESTPATYTNYYNNGYRSQSNYNNNGDQSQSNYNNNGYETEQQGISQSQSNYNNNGYQNQRLSNYNKNGYETEQQGMSQSQSQSNYNNNGYQSQSQSNYNNNGYQSKSNYNNNGYETEQQGMSDTKFLENGRYYFDVKKNDNNYVNGYESGRGSSSSDVYYGNNVNPNEFNTMGEYYKSQGEYEP